MAFNDGEPLDAAKLGALELQVNNLKKVTLSFGSVIFYSYLCIV